MTEWERGHPQQAGGFTRKRGSGPTGYEGGSGFNRRPMERKPMERRPMGMTADKKFVNKEKREFSEKSDAWNNAPRGNRAFVNKEESDKENEDKSDEEKPRKPADRTRFISIKPSFNLGYHTIPRGGVDLGEYSQESAGSRGRGGFGADWDREREKDQDNEDTSPRFVDERGGRIGPGNGARNGFNDRNKWDSRVGDRNDKLGGKENEFRSGRRGSNDRLTSQGEVGKSERRDRAVYDRGVRDQGNDDGSSPENVHPSKKPTERRKPEVAEEKIKTAEKPRMTYVPPEPPSTEEIFSNGLKTGINFSKYDYIPMKMSGENAPKPIKVFNECNFCEIVLKNLKKSIYKVPTPIQKIGIPVIMHGRDLMGCAQTGSGKTAAFLVPIINHLIAENVEVTIGKPSALILAPTRELAVQIYTEARKFAFGSSIKSCVLYGGTSTKHQNDTLAKGCHILIATPGRFLDFVDKGRVKFDNIRFVVLDEADRMLDLGFKENIEKIMNHCNESCHKRQTLMFSATFPKEIQMMASNYLTDYIFASVGVVGGACSDIIQTILEVPRLHKRQKLIELLEDDHEGIIVFVETKRGTDFIASFLSEKDIPTTSIHGDRLQSQRELALQDFKRGKMKVLVATSIAARGLDIKGVKHVINFDLPTTIEDYVHRIGRTGRLGNNGKATSFFDPERDTDIAPNLIKILEGSNQKVPAFLKKYCTGRSTVENNRRFAGSDMREDDEDDF